MNPQFITVLLILWVAITTTGCFTAFGVTTATEVLELEPTQVEERSSLHQDLLIHSEFAQGDLRIVFEQSAHCEQREILTTEVQEIRSIPRETYLRDMFFAGLFVVPSTAAIVGASFSDNHFARYTIYYFAIPPLVFGSLYGLVARLNYTSFPKYESLGLQTHQGSWEPYDCANQPISGKLAQVLIDGDAIYGGNTSSDGSIQIPLDTIRRALAHSERDSPPELHTILSTAEGTKEHSLPLPEIAPGQPVE